MDHELEGYIIELKNYTPSVYVSGNERLQRAKEITEDIKNIVDKSQNNSIVLMLMEKNYGLTSLLSKYAAIPVKDVNYNFTVYNTLEILEQLMVKFGENMSNYLVAIKNSAVLYTNSTDVKVRQVAYSVLCQVVVLAQSSSDEMVAQLELPTLSKQLFEVLAKTESSNTTRNRFLILLGKLAQYFPNVLEESASRLINQIMYELDKQARVNVDRDNKIVSGCIEALAGFLYSFHTIINPKVMKQIHDYLLMLILRGLTFKPRSALKTQRAALDLLAEHASLFNKWLLGQFKTWFDALKSCTLSTKEVQESGIKALGKFIEESVQCLKNEVDLDRKSAILEFFVRAIREILECDQSSLQLKSVGVKALGQCSFSVTGANVSYIFEYLLKKTAFICIQGDAGDTLMKIVNLLPVCLESLGLVLMRHAVPLGIEQTQQLQKMCVHLFSRYLDIADEMQCGRSVVVFLAGVQVAVHNPFSFSDFLGDIVMQSLIRSSRPDLDPGNLQKYISLWVTFVNFSRETDLPINLADRIYISEVLDVQLVSSISSIIGRLNFSINETEDSTEVEIMKDETCGPQNPVDWQLFNNLVDLLEVLLKSIEPKERLQDLLVPVGVEIVEISAKFPFVPGLYRLVATVLHIIGEDLPTVHHPAYQIYISSLIHLIAQFSDDVLVSAVQAILSSPAWLVTSVRGSMSGALTSALNIGLTYPPMAEWPLSALEHWQTTLPFSSFDSILEDVLPYLEPYLNTVEQLAREVPFISAKRFARAKTSSIPREHADWNKIQRRVLSLLGRMGPKCSRLVSLKEDEDVIRSATGWQISGHLEFGLPLSDMKPIIELDAFLPRIILLVQQTSDIKLRMAACEFFHASVVFLTGINSRRTEDLRLRYPLTPLYSKIIPTILSLAVDTDEVIRKLFNDLLFQLVRWFARPAFQLKESAGRRTILGAETSLLLEQVMESACSGADTSLVRDLAGDCLSELLKWNIKQTNSDAKLWEDPALPDFLFQKLRASATHPSPLHRLGAASVLNKLHRIIRQSDPLTSVFTMDLLAHFVVCLSLAEQDAISLGTVHEIKQALYHLSRTVLLKQNLFTVLDTRRRVAPFLVQGTIPELLEFLLRHAFGSQKHCRHVCAEMFIALAHPQSITDVTTEFLSKFPLETFLEDKFPFSARLDVYRWLLRHDVIETNVCDADVSFVNQFEAFTNCVNDKMKDTLSVSEFSISTTESMLAWLEFLLQYIPKSRSSLFVRIDILVRAALLPAKLGFSVFATAARQHFYACVGAILPLLAHQEEVMRLVLTSMEFQLDDLDWTKAHSLDILHGLVFIATTGCMGTNVSYCKPPTTLLKLAVDNIMKPTKTDSQARFKACNMLIELAVLLGLKMEILVAELTNPANIPDSTNQNVTHGQCLRSKLGQSVFLLVLHRLTNIEPFLPQMGNGDSQQWILLLELLQVAQRFSQDLTNKRKWIVRNVLDSWNTLETHAESYNQRIHLRLVIDCLAKIDLDLVGRSSSVKRWIINSWNHPTTNITFASELAQLLNIFVVECSESDETNLTTSLQQFFTNNFPSKITAFELDSEKTVYFSILNRMILNVRVPVVFLFLIDVFALEPHHPSLSSFVESIKNEDWTEQDSELSLGRALNKLHQNATTRTISPGTRIEGIELLYVPLLKFAPSSIVERHLNQLLADLIQIGDDSRSGVDCLTQKTIGCAFLSVAILRVDSKLLTSSLNASFCALKNIQPSVDGKDFLRFVGRFAMKIRQIKVPLNERELDIYQNMESHAFRLLQSVATASSMNEDAVDALIFKPMTPEIWNAVVGTTKQYNLSVETEFKRKIFAVYIPTISPEDRPIKGYISSQFLFESSLKEDVYQFDFNQGSILPSAGSFESRDFPNSPTTQEESAPSSVNLTLDVINKHPCMGLLTNFLEELYKKYTLPKSELIEPKWMISLRAILLSSSVHQNVVLFIVRLIINLKTAFQPFAKSWYKALLLAFLRKIGGEPLNTLFREGLNAMLEWSIHNPPPVDDIEFVNLASRIFKFIVQNVDHPDSEILKDNMDMLKAVLIVWKKIPLGIPYEIIEEMLTTIKSETQILGLQIWDAIILHGFLPTNQEFRVRFKQLLVDLLAIEDKRKVTRLCASLCGSLLLREADLDFEKRVCGALQKWYQKKKVDVFVDLLFEVSRRQPTVLVKFANINLSLLGTVYGTLKTRCLEILAISWQYMEDPWKEIGFETIETILKGSNPGELCPTLSLVLNLIPRVEISDWKPLWPTLVRLSRHQNVACRSRLYEVFKKALDLIDPIDPEIAQAVLRGCTDQDQELAVKMQNFLAEKLPSSTTDRLLAYLTDFYTPGSEEFFLSYCSHFLLERSTQSHVYVDPIFDQPLDDIPFEVFDLASFSSQSTSFSQRPSFGRGYSHGTFQHGWIRATQNVSTSSVTQAPANWLMIETQSSVPSTSQRSTPSSPSKTTQNVSKLAVSSPLKSWKKFTSEEPSTPTKLSYEPRLKSQEASGQPTIYRKYRKGELPDIQIPPSALIAPLQAVALKDSSMAKILFCHLLTAIRKQVKEIQGNDEQFATKLNTALELIVERAHPRNSNLLAAVMEYFWINKVEPAIDTEKLVQIAKASHLQPLGILVLESNLPVNMSFCPIMQDQRKKSRQHEVKHPTRNWFHVADMYGDLKDFDSVRAIVAHLTDCKSQTKKAIECEMKSDWSKAFQYYSQVLGDETPSTVEISFCSEYRLKCLEELGKWDEIGRLKPQKEPWKTRSLVRNSLQNSKTSREVQDLNRISLPSVDPALLPDLAALALQYGIKDRAAVCISKFTDDFLNRYNQLSVLNFRSRKNLLQYVCIITEMQTFMENSNLTGNASLPQSEDNLVIWDFVLALRNFFAQSGEKQLTGAFESVNSLRLQLATIAMEQQNVGLARKLAMGSFDIHEPLVAFRLLIRSKIFAMESLTISSDTLDKLDRLILAKETINSAIFSTDRGKIDRERLEASLCAQVFQVITNMQPMDLIAKQDKLVKSWGVQPREMAVAGLQHARHQAGLAEKQGNEIDLAEAYLFLAKYCYEWKSAIPNEDYTSELTRSVLTSMRYGSIDGQALFPLVILAAKNNDTAATAFEHFRSHVPLTMFLPWVNQLVSHFTSSQVIAQLLIDMAERHPTHVKVPFGITRSSFSPEMLNMNATRFLESKLPPDPTWEMFLKSTDYLHPPEKAAHDFLNSDTGTKDFSVFQSKYLNLPPPTATSAHGHVHYMFSLDFTTKFQEAFDQGRLKELTSLLGIFKKKTSSGRKSLRDYSPWLANYRFGDNVTNELELPTLRGKTIKVEAFRDDIHYLHSKQLPVRLTFVVDGAVEYPILLKHGEDVRQDERITQLLDTIDVALKRDVESRKRNLRIRTFQVIPLTTTCGIFQWMTDTLTLKAFLETASEYRSSLSSIKSYIQKTFPAHDIKYYMNTSEENLLINFSKISDRVYPYGLKVALKKLSQSPEAFFYLRNRMSASHGTLCSALWILGVGDRHLSNFLVSTKNGDIIGIDYGMAFGTATFRLAVPEVVPCRLTTQFQCLIPGLGLNGPIRESMDHTLRVAKAESDSIIASLSAFVSEPTLDWLKHSDVTKDRMSTNESINICWASMEIVQRTENLLKGFHPSEITCRDLQKNNILLSDDGKKMLVQLCAAVRGKTASKTDSDAAPDNKRKRENDVKHRTNLPSEGLSTKQQVDCLIEQSTDPACLSRMYWGWEPWV